MIRNYFAVAIRNILKYKVYSIINILGLAIGMAACLVIFLFIQDELSFDEFNSKKHRIYRLNEIQSFEGMSPQKVALSMPGMGHYLSMEMPEVESYTRFWKRGPCTVKQGENKLLIKDFAIVDSTFFQLFDYKLLEGNTEMLLSEPYSLVFTKDAAQKFFGRTDILGEQVYLDIDEEQSFKVTGVMDNVPENSHLKFEVLLSMNSMLKRNPEFNDRWGSNFLNTYLLLKPKTDPKNLESKFADFVKKHIGEEADEVYTLFLQPLKDIHLGSMDIEHDYNNYRKFDKSYIRIFAILAFFVLVIASINFMNLSVARSTTRAKEVGIRKTIGAQKLQLVGQYLGEHILLAFISLLLAIAITALFLPAINNLAARSLSLTIWSGQLSFLVGLLLLTVCIGIVSGAYPAFFISSFQSVKALKGKLESFGKGNLIQNGLVVLQFSIAIMMIVGTIIAMEQLQFMKNRDIGYNKDHMILIPTSRQANQKYETLKNEFLSLPRLTGVTASGQRMGNNLHQTGAQIKNDTTVRRVTVSQINVDHDFLKVYDIDIKKGRDFSRSYSTDEQYGFIINQELADELELTEPIGTSFGFSWLHEDSLGTIVGITDNFNFNSLHHSVNTLCLHINPHWGFTEISVKVKPEDLGSTLAQLEETWNKLISDRPFEYEFLDEHFEELYRADQQLSSIISIIAVLAIIIACMGLFGLAAIVTEKRLKEIGIRKVLGAPVSQLLVLISRNFAILVGISILLAVPVSYLLVSNWLQNFAFRITVDGWVFMIAGLVSFLIAMFTISFQTIKAARVNPVDLIRNE